MKIIILGSIILGLFIQTLSQDKNKKPFVLKLIEKPTNLKIGKKYRFVFEVKNVSKAILTMSSLCAVSIHSGWKNEDGTSGATGSGCGSSTTLVGDKINPVTKIITGKDQLYIKDLYFTLPKNGSKRFETILEVSQDIKTRWIDVIIEFEPKYNGNEIGLNAWTGDSSFLRLKMSVLK